MNQLNNMEAIEFIYKNFDNSKQLTNEQMQEFLMSLQPIKTEKVLEIYKNIEMELK
jgi:hypothetical protein